MPRTAPAPSQIIGPFSAWPRRRSAIRLIAGTSLATGGGAAMAAFLHCIVPVL